MKIKLLTLDLSVILRKRFLLLLMMIPMVNVWAQTNPTAQNLPYSQDFSALTGSITAYTAIPGWQGWNITTASLGTSFPTAAPGSDRNLTVGSNTAATASITDMTGKLGIYNSSGTVTTPVLAIKTSGLTSVKVNFNAGTQRTENTRQNELGLQYRVGTSGTFTDVAGSTYQNQMTPTNTTGTGAVNIKAVSVTLPVAAENQAVVQLRWVIRDISGSGNRPGFSIDDISITSAAPTAAPVVTGGTVTGTAYTAITNYQISATNGPTSYAVATGTLPTGLSLNTTTGIISGTPSVAGTSSITVTATNGAGTSSAATINFNIAKANQTITFSTLANKVYGDANFTLAGTSSSALTVSFTSSNTAVATVSGTTVTIVGAGSTNITASQAGNANYNAAPDVVRSLTVTAKPLTITGLTPGNKVYNASNVATVTGSGSLNGVLTGDVPDVVLAGTPTFTFNNANVGTAKPITITGYSLTGSKAANYSITLPSLSANVTAKPLTVTGAVAQNKVYDGTTTATITGATLVGVETADTSNVNLAAAGTFASSNVGAGIAVTLSLTGSGIGNYTLTQPGLTADITKTGQTITFNTIPVLVLPSASVNLNTYASASSGLAVTYASSNPAVASVSGNTMSIVGAGTVTITASQAGNENYDAAANVAQVVTIITKPVATAGTTITNTTFTANWQAVPGATSYEIDVYKIGGTALVEKLAENFNGFSAGGTGSAANGTNIAGTTSASTISSTYTETPGWSGQYVYQAGGTAKMGGASTLGSITTPSIDLSGNGGNFTVDFDAMGWNGASKNLKIYLNNTLVYTVNDMNNDATYTLKDYSIELSGGTAASTIRFEGNTSTTGRFFLDNLVVKQGGASTEYILQNQNVGNATSYTVSGLEANTEYFYVVRAINGSVHSPDSNIIDVTTKDAIVWNGTSWSNSGLGPNATTDAEINGEYSENESFEVNNLTITSTGTLTIQSEKDVTIHGSIILAADNNIVMESDANLIQKTAGADTNPTNYSIIVKRNSTLPTKGYTFWSSPVTGQNLYGFSNGYNQANGGTGTGTPWNRFYVYNEATDYFVTAGLSSASTFETGLGYAIKGMNNFGDTMPYTTNTFSFTGKINNGQVFSQPLANSCTVETGCVKGYNLVGNPYPSSIDFEALYNANSSKIYGTAYFWTNNDITVTQQAGTGYSGNNYAIYNLSGGTSAVDPDPNQGNGSEVPNGIVKVGQGFIVKAKVAGKGQTLEFNNDMRLGYDPDAIFYNSRKADKNRFWLTLTSPANVANSILVAYVPEATNDFEINYDGELFVIGSDSFYSKLGSRKLAIQGKADFNVEDKVTLGNVYSKNGEYKISIKDKEGIFKGGQDIYLKDKVLNKVVNLSQGDYTFQGVKGTDETRFEIVYKSDAVLSTDAAAKSDFSVYKDGNSYVITSSKKLGKVEVYDTAGRLMKALSTNETSVKIDASALSNGVYIFKVENSGDVKTKKVIK